MAATKRQRSNYMRRKDPLAVRRARKRARLTQRELAFLARCSQTTIYLLEKPGPEGMETCSDEMAMRICDRLHVDVEDLFEARTASSSSRLPTGQPRSIQPAAVAGGVR